MSTACFKTIIAGPCSAESEQLCLSVAAQLADSGLVDVFRAGVWKPRTLSGMYEGPGNEGLKYLNAVKQQFGFSVATEAATAAHAQACLKAGIDVIWIGARTVTDPFSVQELAEALQGTSIRVMVKNPLVPDLRLWTGATERLLKKGVKVEALIHRGFSVYEQSVYRNEPLWALMSEMKRQFPELLLIADPSHMAGKAAYVGTLAQQALEMEADGLMVEVHPEPLNALSDAAQQIVPAQFLTILKQLCAREGAVIPDMSIEELRSEIDEADEKLLKILAQRASIVKRMGQSKRNAGMTIMQTSRWQNVVESRLQKANQLGLDSNFVEELLKVIHDESLRIQLEIMNLSAPADKDKIQTSE